MLNALQKTDGLEESKSPINNPQRQGSYFPFVFITLSARKVQSTTEMLLKLLEIILFTLSQSFDHSCNHLPTNQTQGISLSQSLLPTFSTLLQNCLTSLAMVEAILRNLACSSLRARSSFCRCSSWCRITMRTTYGNKEPACKHPKSKVNNQGQET